MSFFYKKFLPKKKNVFKKLNINFVDVLVLISIWIFSWWLMTHTLQYKNGQFIMASKVWSDFAAHIPLIRSFSMGENIPPEYPLFPGEPIRYHFLFYFLVGMMEKIGLNLVLSLNVLSALGFSLLLWMIYKTTFLFFKSRLSGLLAVFLFLFNGSLSFVEFFKKNPLSVNSWRQITEAVNFISFGPWDGGLISAFWNLNIYTNQRHLGLSFGLLLFMIWPLMKMTLEKKYVFNIKLAPLIWLIFIIFPVLHQAGFVALIIFALIWIVAYYLDKILLKRRFIKNKSQSETILGIYFVGIVLSVATFVQFYGLGSGTPIWKPGFLSTYETLWELAEFWIYNLGLYVLLLPLIIVWMSIKKKKAGFLFAMIFSSYFVLANLFRLSSDMINNHKFVNLFMIGMNILVAGFLVERWRKRKFLRVIIIPLVFFLVLSGFMDFYPIKNDHYLYLNDISRSETMTWISENTLPDSIFLTTTYLNHPASIAGRKIFLDYGYFAWSLGYNDRARRNLLPSLFSPTVISEDWCDQMNENNLDYVIISPGKGNLAENIVVNESYIVRELTPTYITKDNNKIYKVSQYCDEKNN